MSLLIAHMKLILSDTGKLADMIRGGGVQGGGCSASACTVLACEAWICLVWAGINFFRGKQIYFCSRVSTVPFIFIGLWNSVVYIKIWKHSCQNLLNKYLLTDTTFLLSWDIPCSDRYPVPFLLLIRIIAGPMCLLWHDSACEGGGVVVTCGPPAAQPGPQTCLKTV